MPSAGKHSHGPICSEKHTIGPLYTLEHCRVVFFTRLATPLGLLFGWLSHVIRAGHGRFGAGRVRLVANEFGGGETSN